jgi:hypothetical protein
LTNEQLTNLAAALIDAKGQISDDSKQVGLIIVQAAILSVGRTPKAPFNQEHVTFTMTAGQAKYVVGQDFQVETPNVSDVEDLWYTDTGQLPVRILDPREFNPIARTMDRSARPTIATFYQELGQNMIEVWPTPDSAYEVKGVLRRAILKLEQIPEVYHDVLVAQIAVLANSVKNGTIAASQLSKGLQDIRRDGSTKRELDILRVEEPLDTGSDIRRADSMNLRGL